MNFRTVFNYLLVAAFLLLAVFVASRWKSWGETTTGIDGETQVNNYKVIYRLISIIGLAVIGGGYIVTVLLPKLGDAMGTAMLSSGEEVTPDEGRKAAAKMAAGDYEGAIEEYEAMMKEKPDDPFPVYEIAKVLAEKLEEPDRALAFLRENLETRTWSEDDTAFLMFRMIDMHMGRHELDSAKAILEQVIGTFPGTRHSANANHKIHEIEQIQFKEMQAQRAAENSLAAQEHDTAEAPPAQEETTA